MSIQSICGVIIQACMAGIIFAKFTVPRKRGQTIVYSKNAVITLRNGCLYLICRITDLRKSSLLEAHVRMIIIRKEDTDEGESIPYQMSDLDTTTEVEGSDNDRVLILWPVTIAHKIGEDSPLYDMNPKDLLTSQFEIVITMEGVTEETGNTIQVSTVFIWFLGKPVI
jgi:potassium inwardly-rectifying channel subfamily J